MCINHIFNGLVKKMVDDLGSIFFPQISLLGKILEFSYELNKMHDIGIQSLGNKENKKVV